MTPHAWKYVVHKRHEAFSCRYENTVKFTEFPTLRFFISLNVHLQEKYAAWSSYFYVFDAI